MGDGPVPSPSLKPPRRLLASLSRSQTVSSTQASVRSSCLMPSYTIVWLNIGSTVLRSTRVFWRLFLLVSGSTRLKKRRHVYITYGLYHCLYAIYFKWWCYEWRAFCAYHLTYGSMVALIRGRFLHSFTQMWTSPVLGPSLPMPIQQKWHIEYSVNRVFFYSWMKSNIIWNKQMTLNNKALCKR